MDDRRKSLLDVALFFMLILSGLIIAYYFKPVRNDLLLSILVYGLPMVVGLIFIVLSKRDFSSYGLTFRYLDVDLAFVSVWIIPSFLIFIPLKTDSGIYSIGALTDSLPGLIIEAFMLVVTTILLKRTSKASGNATRGILAATLAGAFITLITVPALFQADIHWPLVLLTFISSFVFISPGEEILFRGFIQSRLNEAFGRPYRFLGINWGVGLIITSLIFGLLHIFHGYIDVAACVALGFVLGLVREKTGTIIAPAILHGAMDFGEFIFI